MSSLKLRKSDIDARGYRLATANILYRLPDYPALLQSFVWQQYDRAPEFPELCRFLDFWRRNIEGELHTVFVAHAELVTARQLKFADGLFQLQ